MEKRIMLMGFFVIIIMGNLLSKTQDYIPHDGDIIDIFIVGNSQFSFSYTTPIVNGNIFLKKKVSRGPEIVSPIYWKTINIRGLNMKEIQDSILKIYRREISSDTVIINVEALSSESVISLYFYNHKFISQYKQGKALNYYIRRADTTFTYPDFNSYHIFSVTNGWKEVNLSYIPEAGEEFYIDVPHVKVIGEVKNNGIYPYIPNLTFTDYIALAGGVTDKGDINNITIISQDGKKKNKKDKIKEGDIIIVKSNFYNKIKETSTILSILISISSIITTIILLQGGN